MPRLITTLASLTATWLIAKAASADVATKIGDGWVVHELEGKVAASNLSNDCQDSAKKHKRSKARSHRRRPRRRWRPKRTRAKGPQKPPDPKVRRATAGPGAEPVRNDPALAELAQLQAAEREMFPPRRSSEMPTAASATSFPPSMTLLPAPGQPVVSDTGLPPQRGGLADARDGSWWSSTLAGPPDFLDSVQMPDWPVRWSQRTVSYLRFYKEDPRGRAIAAIWYRRSGGYEPMIHQILRGYGLPTSLMWVAVVESGLRPTVYSSAGAAGLWQMMPATARLYGLVVDRWVDERLDPVRSTRAAVLYLQDLHRRFGSWDLALAAYNMGFGGLLAAIRKYNTNDYWELARYEASIPWETTLYVPKIKAMSVVATNPKLFGLDPDKRNPPIQFDEVDAVPGTSLQQIADAAEVDLGDIQQLNPQFLVDRVPPHLPRRKAAGVWKVRVPRGRGAKVAENLVKQRTASPPLGTHVMRRGERLSDVARGYGVSLGWLRRVNAIRRDEVLSPGTVILVPKAARKKSPSKPAPGTVVVVHHRLIAPAGYRVVYYQVVAGDTLAGIATSLGVDKDWLRAWNSVDPDARLQRGMILQALVRKDQDLSHMKVFESGSVKVLVTGSEEFFEYFENKRGRKRVVVTVGEGETWRDLAKKAGCSVGSLERINRRSSRKPLEPGERIVLYVSPDRLAKFKQQDRHATQPRNGAQDDTKTSSVAVDHASVKKPSQAQPSRPKRSGRSSSNGARNDHGSKNSAGAPDAGSREDASKPSIPRQ